MHNRGLSRLIRSRLRTGTRTRFVISIQANSGFGETPKDEKNNHLNALVVEQAESANTIAVKNRHKDTVRWKALALEYEMKIRYLERALAQEESKLRIAEQVISFHAPHA